MNSSPTLNKSLNTLIEELHKDSIDLGHWVKNDWRLHTGERLDSNQETRDTCLPTCNIQGKNPVSILLTWIRWYEQTSDYRRWWTQRTNLIRTDDKVIVSDETSKTSILAQDEAMLRGECSTVKTNTTLASRFVRVSSTSWQGRGSCLDWTKLTELIDRILEQQLNESSKQRD